MFRAVEQLRWTDSSISSSCFQMIKINSKPKKICSFEPNNYENETYQILHSLFNFQCQPIRF